MIFLEKAKRLKVPSGAFLFSLDVDSLYIETPLGLKAVRDCFEKYPDVSWPDEAILELLELSLTTAMGNRFVPAYANIYMAQWEETILPKCPRIPFCYLRYLDDVWGMWHHSHQDFQNFPPCFHQS